MSDADTIKCTCSHCGAKYRLPLEAQGRSARCKRCGERFEVPRQQSLEDSIMSWLANPEAEEEDAPARPRVIRMEGQAGEAGEAEGTGHNRRRGTIRMNETPPKPDQK